jgi:hypothetical protein
MKTCNECNIKKPLTKFRVVRKNKNGSLCYKAKCNDCFNKCNNYLKTFNKKTIKWLTK